MEYNWIFDGIGTALIIFVLGLMVGGGVTYKFINNKNIKQIQKAGNDSKQVQIGEVINDR